MDSDHLALWLFAVGLTDATDCVKYKNHSIYGIKQILEDFSNGKFYNPWATQPIIIEPTRKKMTELSENTALSQRAVYADMFGFKNTLSNFNHNEIAAHRSRLFSLILSVRGKGHLRQVSPYLHKRMEIFVENELSPRPVMAKESIKIGLADTCKLVNSRLMAVAFFGEKLASEPIFAEAIYQHPLQTVTCMSLFQLAPSFMYRFIAAIVTRNGQAMRQVEERVCPIIEKGVDSWDHPSQVEHTILYNMIEETKDNRGYWTPVAVCQAIMGLWLAASHQPWVNLYIFIYQLCTHPEWQDIIREEFRANGSGMDFDSLENLPLLDSFMRESSRFHCLDKLNIRRKAMRDYTFSDGSTFAPKGSTVCISNYEVSHDPGNYPNPDIFDGFRFVRGRSNDRTTGYADVSEKNLMWGYGSLACPGRVHASFVIKFVLCSLLLRYDMRLEREDMRSHWTYESFSMPYGSTNVLLQPRTETSRQV
ncbi:cytochrome P450 [Penicillium tannophilum]|nr:cytochrome P450 [Penicillium tannophilum]